MLSLAPANALATNMPHELVPMGNVVGITAVTDGAMVVGTVDNSVAEEAGIKTGDIITEINDQEIAAATDIGEILQECTDTITVTVDRGGKCVDIDVTPKDGQIGVWLRDCINGIGTITYYDPSSESYGALGHSICDCDTGVMLPIRDGDITNAFLSEIVIGQPGSPGQLQGIPDFANVYGSISVNTDKGIFGKITNKAITEKRKAYPIADDSEIKTGEAVILSDAIDGEMREYTVEISRLFTGIITGGKDMMITVTDERLLENTGGIVQGMSGSPIIQDGKFIGAVTHVLINQPDTGYGIFIENMLEAAA